MNQEEPMQEQKQETASAEQPEEEKTKNPRMLYWIFAVLAAVTVGCIAVTVWAVGFRKSKSTLVPDYAPVSTEEKAEPIGDEGSEKLEQQEGGGSVSLTYSREVKISLTDKSVSLLFGNPTRSNQDIVLQIVVKNTVVAQSGRLTPGNQIKALDLSENVLLQAGTYEGKFVVSYYQQDTGEKAIVNTEIPIQIVVS